jgi:uncharacterized membrane protein HdeD (DUF308 family)
MGALSLAAGICTIIAGLWKSGQDKSWLLVLNGLALGTLGLIYSGTFGFRISFRTISLLITLMALSLGIFDLVSARAFRRLRHAADEWFLGVAGVASVGFALAFLAFVFRWLTLNPSSPGQSMGWLGAYFGFTAICMIALAVRVRGMGPSQVAPREALPTTPTLRPAH